MYVIPSLTHSLRRLPAIDPKSTWEWFGLKPVFVVRFLHLGQHGLVVIGLRYLVDWFGLD